MIQVGTSFSNERDAAKAAETVSRNALAKSGTSKADVAIFFATSDYRHRYYEILSIIKKTTGAKKIIGASGSGIITEEIELERNPAIAVMVIASDEIEATPFLLKNLQENNFHAGECAAEILRASDMPPDILLLFPDPFSFQSHFFFDSLDNHFGYVPILGGSAAEDGKEEKTYQMEGSEVAFDAAAGLALGGNFRMETGITRSCQPFGEPFQITRAEGNMIYEMDGRPAYDILLESISTIEFSTIGVENPDQIFQRIFLGFPLKSFQTDFAESPYLIRNILGVNAKKGMVACTTPIEEGEFVTFTVRDPDLARQNLRDSLDDIRRRITPDEPFLGFYFNCCARGKALYGKSNQDTALIREYFPGVPLLGFFTYGEIAPIDHVNHLHHHSAVLGFLVKDTCAKR